MAFGNQRYYVYILGGKSAVLYTGVTNDLERRMSEHKSRLIPGFTSKYNLDRLMYYETCSHVREAIAREKQIKGWLRAKEGRVDRVNKSPMGRI